MSGRVQIYHNKQITSDTNPLPVSVISGVGGGLTDAELRATPVPVSFSTTDLDIRNLVFATDKVDASGSSVSVTNFPATQPVSAATLPLPTGAATAALQTQPGVDIGDVTVNNGAGASAVNIQDGGNSITVDGPLTDAQLRATEVPVSLTSTTITGTVITDTELPTAAALGDTDSNPTTPLIGASNMVWNGTTWTRAKGSDGDGASATGMQNILPMIFNGTTHDRLRGDTTNGLDVDVTRLPSIPSGTNNIGDVDVLTLPSIPAGTNNIGDVDVLTLPSIPAGTNNIGDVDVLTLPALPSGTNRVGGSYDVGGQIIDEVPTVRTVNRAFVNASATGNTSLVAAQGASVRIRVLGVMVVSTLANSVKFQSATTDISALFPLAANAGFVLPYNPHGWFQTAANEALNVNLSVATATGVQIIWVQAT